MKALLSIAALVGITAVADASAQERRRLDMPAGMHNPGDVPPLDPTMPPGLGQILHQNAAPAVPQAIVSSGSAPSPARPPTVDFYNNLTRGTWDQIRNGREPTLPNGELKGENRWAMPPSVGVVVQRPLGATDGNGNAPASLGFNAGPGVQPDGTTGGVAINARVRVPFGR